ncbi:RpsU-divergently transcribed [Sphingopyxis sp. H071]|uniref:COQ9 family protein n=1 Tax=unclassified Sphingopyxis TaxID=2614943 RepID=UPI000731C7D9|nr:RpsU-divergently transcribed [Sphingopyxis sp. H057]KTE54425.1 RpsU-divergently transcribed [Sphingopyxis sp. H073]KTE54804.1 RpsU-divergently transcribed [Sphingopyxis sp. H107]KTE56746.1 RpsU-divergently transcribed [Sphingopyxis sp. H071]KTE66780.1 RpsU-divergently transcribed [Sphingopyxis sp. H081]KTE68133.1 RpsU-divergently transcribed [Sphingopyxis sp. H100]KTE80626.1 RpsU-divergently transcribed [Sphingopyxis sp. H067]
MRMATTLPADPTLDEIRAALAPLIADNAPFDGFSTGALADAATRLGVDIDVAKLAFPGGARDMVDAWFADIDARMAERWPAEKLATLKIRERITTLVETRIALLAPNRESLRRALALLALPTNAPHAAKLGWRAADLMWKLAGDTATDFNHYSKRTILGAVYGSTMAVFLNDESEDFAETRAFLARRIDQVMRFESWKHRRAARGIERPSLARFVGRLRYPGR